MALRLAITCVALVGLVACGDDDTPRIDFPDAGNSDGGGGGTDAGGGGTDAGPQVCGAFAGLGEPLPASCMPRCNGSTLTALQACAPNDGACSELAINSDTHPTALLTAGPQTIELDCGICFSLQAQSCFQDVCPDEFAAYETCAMSATTPDACNAEFDAVLACTETAENAPMVQACAAGSATARVVQCFNLASGTSAPIFPASAMSSSAAFRFAPAR